jgi:hypothetical protein
LRRAPDPLARLLPGVRGHAHHGADLRLSGGIGQQADVLHEIASSLWTCDHTLRERRHELDVQPLTQRILAV